MITLITWHLILNRIPDEKLEPSDIWYTVAFTFLLDVFLFVVVWAKIVWSV